MRVRIYSDPIPVAAPPDFTDTSIFAISYFVSVIVTHLAWSLRQKNRDYFSRLIILPTMPHSARVVRSCNYETLARHAVPVWFGWQAERILAWRLNGIALSSGINKE